MKYFIYLILYKNIMTNSFIEFPRINQKQGSINLYKILNQIELSIYTCLQIQNMAT